MTVHPDPETFARVRASRKLPRHPEAWIIATLLIAAFVNAIALVA